jgi:hypothetical protein
VVFNKTTRQFTQAQLRDQFLLMGRFDRSDPAHWKVDEDLQVRPPKELQLATDHVVVTR